MTETVQNIKRCEVTGRGGVSLCNVLPGGQTGGRFYDAFNSKVRSKLSCKLMTDIFSLIIYAVLLAHGRGVKGDNPLPRGPYLAAVFSVKTCRVLSQT